MTDPRPGLHITPGLLHHLARRAEGYQEPTVERTVEGWLPVSLVLTLEILVAGRRRAKLPPEPAERFQWGIRYAGPPDGLLAYCDWLETCLRAIDANLVRAHVTRPYDLARVQTNDPVYHLSELAREVAEVAPDGVWVEPYAHKGFSLVSPHTQRGSHDKA